MRIGKRTVWICAVILCSGIGLGVNRLFSDTPSGRVTFAPVETDEVLVNPYMGFAVDARSNDAVQPFRLAHANMSWRDLEPERGRYAFDQLEARMRFQQWRERNVRIVLRVALDYPGPDRHMDIPDWLYELIGGQGVWYDNEYGRGFSPDYRNPALVGEHERLIRALADRYKDDPLIAFVQLGSVGHWGEWHTHDDVRRQVPFPERSVTDRYAEAYIRHFATAKPLLMRRPQAVARDYGMGLYNDAFGDPEQTVNEFAHWFTNGYTSWLTGEQEPAMPDFWTSGPSGGESPHPTRYLEDEWIEETIRQAKLTHISWIGPNAPVREPLGGRLQANIDRLLKTVGYRFAVLTASWEETVKPGGRLHAELRVANRGVAPFYFRWPLELSLVNGDGAVVARVESGEDIRRWLPGEHSVSVEMPVPRDLAPGVYQVCAAILDPVSERPGIDWANGGRRSDGRYPVGTVMVEGDRPGR